jgi:long-chain acyl-CoA synthetase
MSGTNNTAVSINGSNGAGSPATAAHQIPPLAAMVSSMRDQHARGVSFTSANSVVYKSYATCYKEACDLAAAFEALGVGEGDIVAIHGANSYEWLLADLACVIIGATSLALYPNAPPSRALAYVKEMGAKLLLTDATGSNSEMRAALCKVISLSNKDDPELDSVGSLARKFQGEPPREPKLKPEAAFTIVSTSGTLSEPMFFAVHSLPLLYTMEQFKKNYSLSDSDTILLALPLAHLPQRMMVYGAIKNALQLVLSGPTRFLKDSLRFNPTVHIVVPRMLQYIDDRLMKELKQGPARVVLWLLPLLKYSRRLVYSLVGARIFGKKARCIFVGSAHTPKPVLQRLKDLGCPIYEVYGTTELGMIALNEPGASKVGSVGQVVKWGEIKIDPQNSEVQFATPFPFFYGRTPEGKIERDGRFANRFVPTGDIGSIDEDGFLSLRGRLRDFVALSNGEKIFVRPIEERLCEIAGVNTCVVVGNGERELGAVVFTDSQFKFESDTQRAEHFRQSIFKINQTLSPVERIRKFRVVDHAPAIEDGCLTETLKIRRHVINQKYARDYRSYLAV